MNIIAMPDRIKINPSNHGFYDFIDSAIFDNQFTVFSGEGYSFFGARCHIPGDHGTRFVIGTNIPNGEETKTANIDIILQDSAFVAVDRENGKTFIFQIDSEVNISDNIESSVGPENELVYNIMKQIVAAASEWYTNGCPDIEEAVRKSRTIMNDSAEEEDEKKDAMVDVEEDVEKVDAELVD